MGTAPFGRVDSDLPGDAIGAALPPEGESGQGGPRAAQSPARAGRRPEPAQPA
jgi:hypothetical protein